MLINRTDLENFVSIIFGNWCRQLNFAVVFGVKRLQISKYYINTNCF